MMKYIGTSTTSKNTKNTMRSSERNTPSSAASSRSIQAVNAFTRSVSFADASSPIGKSSAVSTIMKRLMPSTPTTYLTPIEPIQRSLSTNW